MKIVENLEQWQTEYQQGWLAHYQATGELDWKRYVRPKNSQAPAKPGIDLSRSRLALISSAGAYLAASQKPFEVDDDLGDYSVRLFPTFTPFSQIAYAHTHYDHTAVDSDPQVLLPLKHLEDLTDEGVIGELAPSVISFSGYQPDVVRTVKETIPSILTIAKAEAIQAALLVPA